MDANRWLGCPCFCGRGNGLDRHGCPRLLHGMVMVKSTNVQMRLGICSPAKQGLTRFTHGHAKADRLFFFTPFVK